MKILILDNTLDRDSWGAKEILAHCRANFPGFTLSVRRAPEGDLPESLAPYDRLILTGSRASALENNPWTQALDGLIRECIQKRKPLLGICYGLQALVRAVAGSQSLRASPTPEIGWTKIQLLQQAPIFQGLEKEFTAFSSHIEEAHQLPKDFRVLAKSARCEVQAIQLGELPVYGLQFHPEKNPGDAKRSIQSRVKQLGARSKKWIMGASTKPPTREMGTLLFKNFIHS